MWVLTNSGNIIQKNHIEYKHHGIGGVLQVLALN